MSLPLLPLLLLGIGADSVTMCTVDARTRTPVIGVRITQGDAGHLSHDAAATPMRLTTTACTSVAVGPVIVRRIGYSERVLVLLPSVQPDTVWLRAVGAIAQVGDSNGHAMSTSLDTSRIVASASERAAVARISATVGTDEIRGDGQAGMSGLVAALPYAVSRGNRNDIELSLRGARAEQVVVTLDGISLNDPSTGRADVADIPLVAIGTAALVLGADPLGSGPGASGGVLALTSATDRALAVRTGAFGLRALEAAWPLARATSQLRVGGSLEHARNDFPFMNTSGATGAESRERRINNDVTRGSLFASALTTHLQLTALATGSDMGMVGPVNVRDYDQDRSVTRRLLVRGITQLGGTQLLFGVRGLSLAYRDPNRPSLDNLARAGAADIELRGLFHAIQWKMGAGSDGVRADHNLRQHRSREFGAVAWEYRTSGATARLGLRADHAPVTGTLPSFDAAFERHFRFTDVGVRAGQSLRMPTLYDLYFASPERLAVRTLVPERVLLDGEVLVRARVMTHGVDLALEGALVFRDTRHAIVWFPGNFSWSPANVGREQLQGVESRVRLRAPFSDVTAWVTWYDAALTVGDLRIPTPYVPRLSMGSRTQASRGPWRAIMSQRAMDRRPFTVGPRSAAYELPAVCLVDLAVAYEQLGKTGRALWSVGMENAGNAQWQSVRGFPAPGRAWFLSGTISSLSRQ